MTKKAAKKKATRKKGKQRNAKPIPLSDPHPTREGYDRAGRWIG